MKKGIKDLILGLIVGIIVSSTFAFALTTYSTDQVLYTKNNQEEVLTSKMNKIYDHIYSGTANAEEIRKNKTGLVNGQLLTGTAEVNNKFILKKTSFTKTYPSQYGSAVSYGSFTANRITYSIDISSDVSNCNKLTKSNLAVERRTITTTPSDFGGVGMDPWTYNPDTCIITAVTNGRKGFQASRSETFIVSVFTAEQTI